MTTKICTITGHRPQNPSFSFDEQDKELKKRLKEEIKKQITERGVTHFISGMSLGTDMLAAEIVLEFKSQYPNITFEVAISCETQPNKWKEKDRDRYFAIMEQCDKETLLQKHYTIDCKFKRNCYMVDSANTIIAVWNGGLGEVRKTVKYAREKGKEVIVITPTDLFNQKGLA